MISVAIVDDHPIARRGLEAILASQTGLHICASAGSVSSLTRTPRDRPAADVAVMDLYLRDDQPALADIVVLSARCAVLVMSASGRQADVLAALRAGARGYITKQSSESSFVAAIESVASGGFYLSSSLAYMLHAGLGEPSRQHEPVLSAREHETLSYIARGLTHAQTASRMGITEATVNTHIERIRRKLGLGNKAELTRMAINLEQQHLTPNPPHRPRWGDAAD
jgi:two-component system, NarL family, nitrate/nitrite response regulator NarL